MRIGVLKSYTPPKRRKKKGKPKGKGRVWGGREETGYTLDGVSGFIRVQRSLSLIVGAWIHILPIALPSFISMGHSLLILQLDVKNSYYSQTVCKARLSGTCL